MQIWSRFWKWYEDKILGSIIIIAIIQFFSIGFDTVGILRFGFFLISSPGRKYSIIGSNHLKTITGIIKSINTNVKNIHHANGSRVRNRV